MHDPEKPDARDHIDAGNPAPNDQASDDLVAARKSAQAIYLSLRDWAKGMTSGCPVRDEAWRFSLSAAAHHAVKFGPGPWLDCYLTRDLIQIALSLGGDAPLWLLDMSLTRAVTEWDEEAVYKLLAIPFISDGRAFVKRLLHYITGMTTDPKGDETWIENLPGEQRAIAHLCLLRARRDLGKVSWLMDVPDSNVNLAVTLVGHLQNRPSCQQYVTDWVKKHRLVHRRLQSIDPQRWP